MMPRRIILGIFAGVCMVAAVWLANRYITEKERALAKKEQEVMSNYQAPVEVVVAAKDLPEGTELEPAHLKMAAVPEKFVQPYAVRSPNQVAGKVTMAPIAADEQVLSTKVRRPEEAPSGATLSSLTPKGKRAVTIAVDEITGVGGFVRPGDIVDILWTVKVPQANPQKEEQATTLTLFQDVPVLAVGGDLLGRKGRQPTGGEKDKEKGYTVTLALSPQETSFLLFAREQGKIQLSLRPKSEDASQVSVIPANITTLMQMQLGMKSSGAVPSRPGRHVEVYKGLKRDVVALSEGE